MNPAAVRDLLAAAFGERRPRCANEAELQARCAADLSAAGLQVSREWTLSRRDRIDMLVGAPGLLLGNAIGVEIKVASAPALTVENQLRRYASHQAIAGLLLVTTWSKHRGMPETIEGKPVVVFHLGAYLL